jgi:hypothetical protein
MVFRIQPFDARRSSPAGSCTFRAVSSQARKEPSRDAAGSFYMSMFASVRARPGVSWMAPGVRRLYSLERVPEIELQRSPTISAAVGGG